MLSHFIIPYSKLKIFFERGNLLRTIDSPILEGIFTLTYDYSNTKYSLPTEI